MTEASEMLAAARRAFERHRWDEARDGFTAAQRQAELGADDLAALAECAWWQGDIDECLSVYEEAYRRYLHGEQAGARRAAMLAIELGFFWFLRGEMAIGSGWISRAHRLLAEEPECVEQAYLRSLEIDEALAGADYDAAIEVAEQVVADGRRYGDETLTAMALTGQGIATVKRGRVPEGLALLDEAMLPVVAGKVDPSFAGNIYCQLMSICNELADYRRAQEWTDATTRWCEGFPNAVMFLGVCRSHRAQLLQLKGEWGEAEAEALRVCDELASMNTDAVAQSYYEIGEVRRHRGDLEAAEEAYGKAHALGRDPQPGLALLKLAQGRANAAADAVASAVAAATDPLQRVRLREAQVEIALAADDVDTARRAAEDVDEAARRYESSGLVAASAHARGVVALAEGDLREALSLLQAACRQWREIGATHRVARARLLLARTHRALGNEDAATLELDAAQAEFQRLGASLDLEEVATLRSGQSLPGGLTPREVEILALVAAGMTNKQVAEVLVISQKTVARHLSNIFVKLGVSSRTAAAAFAFEHGLATPERG